MLSCVFCDKIGGISFMINLMVRCGKCGKRVSFNVTDAALIRVFKKVGVWDHVRGED